MTIDEMMEKNRYEMKPVEYVQMCKCLSDAECDGDLLPVTHDKYLVGKSAIATDYNWYTNVEENGLERNFMTGPGTKVQPINRSFDHYCNKCGKKFRLPELFGQVRRRFVGKYPPGGVVDWKPTHETIKITLPGTQKPENHETAEVKPITHDPSRGGFPTAGGE